MQLITDIKTVYNGFTVIHCNFFEVDMKRFIISIILICLIFSSCAFFSHIEEPSYDPIYATDVNGEFVPIHKDVDESKLDPKLFFKENNGRYTYSDSGFVTKTGIDVSVFQGDIDWTAVKADGIDFAMLRIGFRGYGSKGIMEADAKFEENYTNAKNSGIDVGVYFYSQAVTAEEAREEARFVLSLLGDKELDFPVAYDWEYVDYAEARTAGMTSEQITLCAQAFCDEIRLSGREVSIYFNREIGYFEYDLTKLKDIDFWLAEYSEYPTFIYKFNMWQYTDSGSVDGISSNVDLNIYIEPMAVSDENISYETYG